MNTTILVIEDDVFIRENLVEILQLCGYSTLVALNGKEGLQRAVEEHCDLILCDVLMPKINGIEVFRKLKKNVNTADIPFVFITADPTVDFANLEHIASYGYIIKPFNIPELLGTINKCLAWKNELL